MKSDNEVCICFHVTRRQVEKFIRLSSPRIASQISECYGAGTGCGWCVPFIEKMFEHQQAGVACELDLDLSPEEYRARRKGYLKTTKAGKPPAEPGAPPLEEPEQLVDEICE